VTVLVACATFIGSGVVYRSLSTSLGREIGSVPFPAGSLLKLPDRFGGWVGHDTPFAPEVVEATDTDDHLSRVYVNSSTGDSVSLYIAVGVRFRDLAPHRPEVCYVGVGWTLRDQSEHELALDAGGVLPCQIHEFSRGAIASERLTVLNHYILDGRYSRDVSALRQIAWREATDIRYVAQVQIAMAGIPVTRAAQDVLLEFARTTQQPILELLQRVANSITKTPSSDQPETVMP
jgi:EpsI family protein